MLLAAVACGPALLVARAWLGAWAPDPSVVVLAWAALGPRRTPRAALVLLLGAGRALVLLEAVGPQLLAAGCAFLVVRAAREGLREIGGRRPLLLGALLAGAAWLAAARVLGAWLEPAPWAGAELVLGALWAAPAGVLALRRRGGRSWA